MFCSIHKNVLGIRIDYLEKYLGLNITRIVFSYKANDWRNGKLYP